MAVQQRIIGGGLLLAGIAVVLILLFLFTNKGKPWDEAYAEFKSDIYPRYLKADEAGKYLDIQAVAKDAKKLEKSTTMASVLKEVRSDAAKGNREAQGLLKLLEPIGPDGADAFDRNLKGLFDLDGGWYEERSHSRLRQLRQYLGEALPALLDARRDAKALATVLDQLRLGSGMDLTLPAADPSISNPVVAADALQFLAYGLPPAAITKALAAKGQAAKANSARLVWNQPDATGTRARLAEALGRIPALADTMERAAVALGKAEQDLKGLEDAKKQAAAYVKAATAQLATALEGPARQALEQKASIALIADALKQDAKILKGYAPNAPALGKALAGAFAP